MRWWLGGVLGVVGGILATGAPAADETWKPYRPTIAGDVNDPAAPIAGILRQLPGVVNVRVQPSANKRESCLVHLKNWHYVPKPSFAAEQRQIRDGKLLSELRIDELYEQFVQDVEAVQREQKELLHCLIRHHGLKCVYYEGLIEDDVPFFNAKVKALQEFEQHIPLIRQHLREIAEQRRELERSAAFDTEEHANLGKLQREFEELLERHRADFLQIGAAGQLLMTGELEAVRPIEDRELMAQANPLSADGTIRPVSERVQEAREDTHVQHLLNGRRFAFVILGGAHDLSDNAARLTNGTCECLTVTTKRLIGTDDR